MGKRAAVALALACLLALGAGMAAFALTVRSPVSPQEGVVSSAELILERCPEVLSETPWVNCVQDELLLVAEADGVRGAAEAVESLLVAAPGRFGPYCHAIAHNLGDQLGARGSAERLVRDAPYTCYGGLWHGFLSQRGDMLSADAFTAEVRDLCSPLLRDEDTPAIVVFDCVHGVGHGFGMIQELSLATALQRCMVFYAPAQRYDCATGVASAYSTRALTAAGLVPFDHGAPPAADARFPEAIDTCKSLTDASLQRGCWERMAAFAEASGFSPENLAEACSSAGDLVNACARSLGLRLGAASTLEEAATAQATCRVFADPLVRACLDGVLWHTAPLVAVSGAASQVCAAWDASLQAWCSGQLLAYAQAELGPSRDVA